MTNTTKQHANQPVFRKKLPGGISAAVFQNERDGRTYRSVNLQRSYRHNGKWNRMSIYLDHEHIPFMIEALQGAWRYLNEHPVTSSNSTDDSAEVEQSSAAEVEESTEANDEAEAQA